MLGNTLNKLFLIEGILRKKIYKTSYWKTQCYALNSLTFIDKAIQLNYVGGSYGKFAKPTEFISLVLKLLQILPDMEIALEYLYNEEHKYLTALAAFYIRLVASSKDVYTYLEPLLSDYRKLVIRDEKGKFSTTTIDEFVNDLINKEVVCNVALTKIPKRIILEEKANLRKYQSCIYNFNFPDEKNSKLIENLNNDEDYNLNDGYLNDDKYNIDHSTISKIVINNKHNESSISRVQMTINDVIKFTNSLEEYEESDESEDEMKLDNDYLNYESILIKEKKDLIINDYLKKNTRNNLNDVNYSLDLKEIHDVEISNSKIETSQYSNVVNNEDSIEYWNQIRAKLGLPLLS
jgi:hypothetical protein